jgi:hypothetical protein
MVDFRSREDGTHYPIKGGRPVYPQQKQEEEIRLSTADTAKIIRNELKKKFPSQKFSVTSENYSGGSSIDVRWIDGVALTDVEDVVKGYENAGFDGSIDLKYYKTHYLLPNGEIVLAKSEGTASSGGYYPAVDNVKPKGAKIIHMGANYIFCERRISDETAEKVSKEIARQSNLEYRGLDSMPKDVGHGDTWGQIVHKFLRKKGLTHYKGVRHTEAMAGSWPEDFYVLE